MSLHAVFVGVNKHLDPRINELTGAAKDATAIWALFKDSVSDMSDHRLLDSDATAANIRGALDATLGAASDADTVVVFFAGHGTPRHQLVPYDANVDSIDPSTIAMQELVDRVKSTNARACVIVLDCCFSGGAPARVLEDIPVARDVPVQVTDLGGEGRVVLAAARDDQEALELGQHGLFTAAILNALKKEAGWTDIGVMMDEVARQVRAEANRTGHEQTPVWAGLIEGGIQLPPLQAGPVYAAEFPDTLGIRIGSPVSELSAFGIPNPVLSAWESRFSDLNELQLSAINDYRVLDDKSLLVVAPTTSGKTFVGELAAARAIADGRKAVFLLPFKALANEKFEEFQELYGESLGLRVLRCTGDYADQTEPFVKGHYDLALLTYEMFLGLSVAVPTVLNQIGLVVLDEAQFVTNPSRGIGVELLLTNVLAAHERGVTPQIVALSAVIGDVNNFDDWLGCETLATDKRPVPLVEGVLDRTGTYQYVDTGGQEQREQLLPSHAIQVRRSKAGSQDVIVPLVRKLTAEGGQVIVFRNRRGPSSGCAKYLAAELGLQPAQDALAALPDQDLSQTSQSLRDALEGGTAFHTSDLSREERVTVERAFRKNGSDIRALVATSTVAAGVNTPAETVIIVERAFPGREPQDYTVADYKNMAGRAGRLGFANEGRSILLANDGVERSLLFDRYVCGSPEAIHSSFDPDDLDTWILRLLAQVKEVRRDAVVTLLANTYSGYLASRSSPSWESTTRPQLDATLTQMLELGLLEEEMGLVRLSLLGRACGRSNLKLRSAMRLVELLRQHSGSSVSAETLLAIVHALPEFDDAYTPMFRKGQRESEWQDTVARNLGRAIVSTLQWGAPDTMAYYARCKRVAVLYDWINGVPISSIESTYTINPFSGPMGPGDIRSFADFARFHLAAAFAIADVLLMGQGPAADDVEALLAQLEVGIPRAAVALLDLPVSLPRGSYLALFEAGISGHDQLASLSDERLMELVGPIPAAQLLALRTDTV